MNNISSTEFIDYYKILNIDMEATHEQIKLSYLKLARKHHPDHGGNPEIFKEITLAYETLSNKEKRNDYDIKYLNKNIDELKKEEDYFKLKKNFDKFKRHNDKKIDTDEFNKKYDQLFNDKNNFKENILTDNEFKKRIEDLELERKTGDIENNDESIKNILDTNSNITLNDIFEFNNKNNNTEIINKELGSVDIIYNDNNNMYSMLDETQNNMFSSFNNINDSNNKNLNFNVNDIQEWKKNNNSKVYNTDIEQYLKNRELEDKLLKEEIEKNLKLKKLNKN
jgi:curved DNA-binding protein CbpA